MGQRGGGDDSCRVDSVCARPNRGPNTSNTGRYSGASECWQSRPQTATPGTERVTTGSESGAIASEIATACSVASAQTALKLIDVKRKVTIDKDSSVAWANTIAILIDMKSSEILRLLHQKKLLI